MVKVPVPVNVKVDIESLNNRFKDSTPEEVLAYFLPQYGKRIALASSLGVEDQVLTAMIAKVARQTLPEGTAGARVFTIDTGRLFPECYNLIDRTNDKYDISIEVYSPDHTGVEAYVKEHGVNAFYQSVELRKACCQCRKLEPLRRALSTVDVSLVRGCRWWSGMPTTTSLRLTLWRGGAKTKCGNMSGRTKCLTTNSTIRDSPP